MSLTNPFASPESGSGAPPHGVNPFAAESNSEINPFAHMTPDVNALFAPREVEVESAPIEAGDGGRPIAVKVAAFALAAAGVLTMTLSGLGVWAIFELRDTIDDWIALDPTGVVNILVSKYADDAETVLAIILVGFGSVLTVCYLIFATFIWRGSSWPRCVSPFLVVLSSPAVLIGHVAIAIVLMGLIATVAAWLPAARSYSSPSRRPAQ